MAEDGVTGEGTAGGGGIIASDGTREGWRGVKADLTRLKKFSERGFLRTSVEGAGGWTGVVVSYLNVEECEDEGEANLMRSKKFDERSFFWTSAGGKRRGRGL